MTLAVAFSVGTVLTAVVIAGVFLYRRKVNRMKTPPGTVGDMPKSPSSQYGLKAQKDIDPRGIRVTNGPMR